MRTVKWLWYPYIAYGSITLLQGEQGSGKTSMMLDLAAEMSKGGMPPTFEEYEGPVSVLLQSADDSPGYLKSRLTANGASYDKVYRITGEDISINSSRLIQAIRERRPRLVVFDPVEAFLMDNYSGPTGVHQLKKDIRNLSYIAMAYNCAIILTTYHDAQFRDGYNDFIGKLEQFPEIKSVLRIETKQGKITQRTLWQRRNEYGPLGSSQQFRIEKGPDLYWLTGMRNSAPTESKQVEEKVPGKKGQAVRLLVEELEKGDKLAKEMIQTSATQGIGKSTLEDAKKTIGIESYRKNRQWYWKI